jgi:hypothetical protein
MAPSFFCQSINEPCEVCFDSIDEHNREGGNMVASVIVGAIAGAALGLRFNVSIFVPTILITMAAITFGGIATRHEPAVIALILFGTVASLEVGYVAGCVVRPMLSRYRPALRASTNSRGDRYAQLVSKWSAGV